MNYKSSYKCLGYSFPIAVGMIFAFGSGGILITLLYWSISIQIKQLYVKKINADIKFLESLQIEVKKLIKHCES